MTNNVNETTAKTLSKNKITKIADQRFLVSDEARNSNFLDDYKISEELVTRGWVDLASLNLRYINSKIYNKHYPASEDKKQIFKVFAATRCLSIGFIEFEGCRVNIKKILPDFKKNFFSKKKNSIDNLFNFFLKTFSKKAVDIKEIQKKFPRIKTNDIKVLIETIDDENKFYLNVNKLISSFLDDKKEHLNHESEDTPELENRSPEKHESKKIKKTQFKKIDKNEEKPTSSKENNNDIQDSYLQEEINYRTYTTQFDIFTKAERLISFSELKELRHKFDEECKDNTKLVNHLAKKLEKLLYSLDFSTWKFDQDEGFFDSSRFSQFIANPSNSSIFKLENENTEKNTVVSLLLDNSGSMRGKPIVTSAMTAEIITKTLEKCRVNVEILGFTTKEWKGGKSKKLWEKNKRMNNPGRLNDLLHIVYKDADTPWNQTKLNLGLVLKDGLLKENIDGEALIWASSRLKRRTEKKKILIVISDGAPVDDATLSTNNSNILDNHLREVVTEIEMKKVIDLIAIGIGHDVSKYYSRAFTIDDVEKLGEIIIDNLTEILKEKR